MTNSSKTPSNYYLELITAFPPRPITNELEYEATQIQINKVLDKPEINLDDLSEKAKYLRAYLKILGLTIYDYEEQTESF